MKDLKSAVLENGMDPEKIEVMIQMEAILQDRLADSINLMGQLKQAHWNLKGPDFMALHELFDKIAEESEEYPGAIAERIVQFGGVAEATIRAAAIRTSLPDYPLIIETDGEHVKALCKSLAVYGELVRMVIQQSAELNDPLTEDIFTEISRSVDKNLRFMEAYNQEGQ